MVTDHKALVSLLNGNNKKNKTLFSRLTRWILQLNICLGLQLDWRIIY